MRYKPWQNFKYFYHMRPAIPDEIKRIKGTYRDDRANHQKPKFDLVISSDPPSYLSPTAKLAWNEIVPQFIRARMFQSMDQFAVAMMCNELADYWDITKILEGKKYSIVKGRIEISNSSFKMMRLQSEKLKNVYKILQDFGMSPSSRQKLKIQPPQDDKPPKSPIDKILDEEE